MYVITLIFQVFMLIYISFLDFIDNMKSEYFPKKLRYCMMIFLIIELGYVLIYFSLYAQTYERTIIYG